MKYLLCTIFFFSLSSSIVFSQQKEREDFIAQGYRHYADKEYKLAIEKLNIAIDKDTLNYRPVHLRGLCKIQLDDLMGAKNDFDRSIYLRPKYDDSYFRRALIFSQLKEYTKAIKDYTSAINLNKEAHYYLYRALTYNYAGQPKKALMDCDTAARIKDNLELMYIVQGEAHSDLKDYDMAFEKFNKVLLNHPDHIDALRGRAMINYQLEKYNLSLIDVNQLILKHPENPAGYFYRGLIYSKTNKEDKALEDYSTSLFYSPNSTSSYFNRAMIYSKKEKYKEALNDYNQLILLNPKNILAFYNRAIVHQKLKNIKLALKDVEKSIELYPDFVDAYKLRANLRIQIGDYKGAELDRQTASIINESKTNLTDSLKLVEEEFIAKVTSFSTGSINAIIDQLNNDQIDLIKPFYISLLASAKHKRIIDSWNKKNQAFTAYFLLNDNDDDISEELKKQKVNELDKKIERDFRNGELYLKRAITNTSLGINDRALLDFNKSLHLDADNYMAHFGKSNMLYQTYINSDNNELYSIEQVIKGYDKCIELNPKFAYAYFNRAYLKFQNKNYIGAIDDYSEAINISPSFAEAYLNRALILLILENNEQACIDLSKAGELGITQGYSLINKYCNK